MEMEFLNEIHQKAQMQKSRRRDRNVTVKPNKISGKPGKVHRR